MKNEVLVVGRMPALAMEILERNFKLHHYDEAADGQALLAELAPRLQALATIGHHHLTVSFMKQLPRLRLVASHGVGYECLDVEGASALGVKVTNTPDVLTECTADTAWALLMSVARRTVYYDKYVRQGCWPVHGPAPLTDKVWGESIGIMGLGRIGKAIARRAQAFKMAIAYYGRNQQPDVGYAYYADPRQLAADVKYLVVSVPGGEHTVKLVNREVIDALGPEGYLINVARGAVVDEDYLVEALQKGRLAGAGLDVYAQEPQVPQALFTLDNVVLLPHVGSATFFTRQAMAQLVADNLSAFFAGKPLLTPVN